MERKVGECDALIAVIGENWLSITDPETDERRLDNPEDFVRVEIAKALARDVPVVPVLLDGTEMPKASQLPANLKPLAKKQASRVSRLSFATDVERLMRSLPIELREIKKRYDAKSNNDGRMLKAVLPSEYFEQTHRWTIQEAYLLILLEAFFADDKIDPNEKVYLSGLIKRCRAFRTLPDDELSRLNTAVIELRSTELDAIGAAIAALPKDMHKGVFAQAADLIITDGENSSREHAFLDELIQKMDIDLDEVKKILDVIIWKNQF